jgi:hypothetical protein
LKKIKNKKKMEEEIKIEGNEETKTNVNEEEKKIENEVNMENKMENEEKIENINLEIEGEITIENVNLMNKKKMEKINELSKFSYSKVGFLIEKKFEINFKTTIIPLIESLLRDKTINLIFVAKDDEKRVAKKLVDLGKKIFKGRKHINCSNWRKFNT